MNNKLSIQDLAVAFSERYGIDHKTSATFVKTVFEIVEEYVAIDKLVKIKGFGTFKLISVSDRESVNVNTGERIVIAGHTKLTFTPDNALKDAVNHPFSDFETTPLNESTSIEDMERIPLQQEDETACNNEETSTEQILEVVETTILDEELPTHKSETGIESAVNSPAHEVIETKTALKENEDYTPNMFQETKKESITEPIETVEIPTIIETPKKEQKETQNIHPSLHQSSDGNPSYPMAEENSLHSPQMEGKKSHGWLYAILTILLMVLSYICGHYHILNKIEFALYPDSISTEVQEEQQTPQPIKKEPAVTPSSTASICDSIATDSLNAKQDSVTQKTTASEEDLWEIAKYFPQVPGGEYLIVGDAGRVHHMQVGETLYRIARKELGDRNLIQYLIVFNDFEDPNIIHTGDPIRIPKLVKKTSAEDKK